MINVLTGALIHTFQANSGESGIDPGLAQVTGLVADNGEVRYVYGGDERGNLWRFDLQTLGTPMHMALLRDAASNRQPITAAPTLVEYHGQNIVLVGTGRLLGLTDFGSTLVQSFYAIKDTGSDLTNPRSSLTPRTLNAEDGVGESDLSGAAFNWDTDRGWYFDLPAGQQANTEPAALFGAVVFTTNMVAMTDCSASSYFYAVDIVSGLNVTPEAGQEGNNFASARIGDFTVSAITALGYDGRGSRDFGFTFQRSTTRAGGLGRSVDCPVGSSACRAEPSIRLPDMRRKNSWRQVQRQ
jgi:type IV pilus assembly protein PilY1